MSLWRDKMLVHTWEGPLAPALLHIHLLGEDTWLQTELSSLRGTWQKTAFIFLNTAQCCDSTKDLVLSDTEKNNTPMLAVTLLCDTVLIPPDGASVEPALIVLLGHVRKVGRSWRQPLDKPQGKKIPLVRPSQWKLKQTTKKVFSSSAMGYLKHKAVFFATNPVYHEPMSSWNGWICCEVIRFF